MHEIPKERQKLIEHLQNALDLCKGSETPTLTYLISRALDEARGADRGQGSEIERFYS
jgi:hypothetical protein